MVRSALVLLTAIAVLWHATAGCCAHHDHAAAAAALATKAISCGCHPVASAEDAAQLPQASAHGSPEREALVLARLQRPEGSSPERCGERCSFPQPEVSGVALVKHSLAACNLALTVATLVEGWKVPPAERTRAFDAPPPPHVGHALRRHLALGVLLV